MKNFYEDVMDALKGYVRDVHGGRVNSASRSLGLKDPSVLSQWLTGRRSPSLTAIAPAMDVIGVKVSQVELTPAEYEYIPKVEAVAGCGSSLETSGDVEGMYAFRKEFLQRQALSAKRCVLLDVKGDSMEPVLHQGDTVLVDTGDADPKDGKIYLVTLGDELMVKRVFKTARGVLLRSENSSYPDIPVIKEEYDSFVIHGRVRWYGCVCG